MTQKLKKLFSSTSILFFLFFTGCIPRQSNSQYTLPYSYNPYYKIPSRQEVIYNKESPNYEIKSTPRQRYIIPKQSINKESTFEKILRQSKIKKLKPKKIKSNSCREEFPSNVPRGSIP